MYTYIYVVIYWRKGCVNRALCYVCKSATASEETRVQHFKFIVHICDHVTHALELGCLHNTATKCHSVFIHINCVWFGAVYKYNRDPISAHSTVSTPTLLYFSSLYSIL